MRKENVHLHSSDPLPPTTPTPSFKKRGESKFELRPPEREDSEKLKRGGGSMGQERKEWTETKILKSGGKLGQGVGVLKRGAGTHLQTMT